MSSKTKCLPRRMVGGDLVGFSIIPHQLSLRGACDEAIYMTNQNKQTKRAIKLVFFIWHIPRKTVMFMIRIYQKTLSPDHGPFSGLYPAGYCKYTPTCSQYGYEAIKKLGFVRGTLKAMWRVLRCNPCSKGGHDPVEPSQITPTSHPGARNER